MFKEIVTFIKGINNEREFIPLHEPEFSGNEKKYLIDCIDTGFVSSVGEYVNKFELEIAKYMGTKRAVVVVNGTEALHLSFVVLEIGIGDEVICQPLTFIATINAIAYTGANPIFIDVEKESMGMSADSLEIFLKNNSFIKDGKCFNKNTNKQIKACLPMHSFGHSVQIDRIKIICEQYYIILIEDAAEAMGSKFKGQSLGSFGSIGTLSFNGNKIITCGGGGAIITNDDKIADLAKHLSTQAKKAHQWEYSHDKIGYNFRMPNINAAVGMAQLENLDNFIIKKRELANIYKDFFIKNGINFFLEPNGSYSNYWLNSVLLKDRGERDEFLNYTNANGVMTRPIWQLINKSTMYKYCQCSDLSNAEWLEDRVVNIPSSVTYKTNERN